MAGWYHRSNGHELGQTPGDGEGQGGLTCCSPWVSESDMTRRLNNKYHLTYIIVNVWRRRWHPTPVLLPEKSHGQRSLVGCSPWGHEESDSTERLHSHFSLSCTGEGNGNPLQCFCMENPRDGEPGGLPSMGSHRVRHY